MNGSAAVRNIGLTAIGCNQVYRIQGLGGAAAYAVSAGGPEIGSYVAQTYMVQELGMEPESVADMWKVWGITLGFTTVLTSGRVQDICDTANAEIGHYNSLPVVYRYDGPYGVVPKVKGSTGTLQTGGRQINYNAYIKRLETIDMEYENIRIDTTDISKIAQNTGMPEWKISRIKKHVFSNEHILDSGVKRFDADPEIADAWYRLKNGTYNLNDINLLNHEYFESKFESSYKTDYRTAHGKTEESGRIWDPNKED